MSKAAFLYTSAAIAWAVNFIQATQESTTVSDIIALGSLIATLLTVLGTIIVMLNRTREGTVKELTELLRLERERTAKLEKESDELKKELRDFRDQASKLIFKSRYDRKKRPIKPKNKPKSRK